MYLSGPAAALQREMQAEDFQRIFQRLQKDGLGILGASPINPRMKVFNQTIPKTSAELVLLVSALSKYDLTGQEYFGEERFNRYEANFGNHGEGPTPVLIVQQQQIVQQQHVADVDGQQQQPPGIQTDHEVQEAAPEGDYVQERRADKRARAE